jgi:hypothetical protein
MMSGQTLFVPENRFTLFGIMLKRLERMQPPPVLG